VQHYIKFNIMLSASRS